MINLSHLSKKVSLFAVAIPLLLGASAANAGIMVYPMAMTVKNGNQNNLIKVFSKSDSTQYVKVTVKKVINPGTAQEKDEPVASWQENNLIASPNKIIVPAGSNKAVRLTQIKAPQEETLYRVYFEGVSPASVDVQQMEVTDQSGKTAKAAVSVNMVFAALVRTMPDKPLASIEASQNAQGQLVINSTGNIRAGVQAIDYCPQNTLSSGCDHQVVKKYVYPHQSYQAGTNSHHYPYAFITVSDETTPDQVSKISIKL
ncbi:hypothetical protein AV650_08235 [Serratia fonticola]|nr:hypothetical protein AV650_08235 [Serratia fonticola]